MAEAAAASSIVGGGRDDDGRDGGPFLAPYNRIAWGFGVKKIGVSFTLISDTRVLQCVHTKFYESNTLSHYARNYTLTVITAPKRQPTC